jgi:hypothetical protein
MKKRERLCFLNRGSLKLYKVVFKVNQGQLNMGSNTISHYVISRPGIEIRVSAGRHRLLHIKNAISTALRCSNCRSQQRYM